MKIKCLPLIYPSTVSHTFVMGLYSRVQKDTWTGANILHLCYFKPHNDNIMFLRQHKLNALDKSVLIHCRDR